MAAKLTGREIFIGAATSASVALLAVVVAFLLSQASTLGTHGEKLTNIENSLVRLESNLGKRFDEVEGQPSVRNTLAESRTQLDTSTPHPI